MTTVSSEPAVTLTHPTETPLAVTFQVACTSGNPQAIPACELVFLLTALGSKAYSASGSAVPAVPLAATRSPTILVGRTTAKVRAGHRKTVRVKLNRTGLRLLAKRKKLRVRVTIK